ncbi:LCI8B [Auxenochlorella protothecoides x Auxenochlorella symbiontica]
MVLRQSIGLEGQSARLRHISGLRTRQTGLQNLDDSITSKPVEEGSSDAAWDSAQLVKFLHVASPYVMRHRGRIFVIVVPGEVAYEPRQLQPLLEDLLLLHGLGIRLVIVVGGKPWIDDHLRAAGREPRFEGAYRVTDAAAMAGALHASAVTYTTIAGHMSRAPFVPMVRRHAALAPHGGPAVQVVNGNFTVARRRGIVDGVDFGLMGQVRYVKRDAVEVQLAAGAIVVLTNIGVTSSGELLNCNVYDVATHAAVELGADKLLCLTGQDVADLGLPAYLPLDDAEALIARGAGEGGAGAGRGVDGAFTFGSGEEVEGQGGWGRTAGGGDRGGQGGHEDGRPPPRPPVAPADTELQLDLDSWQQIGFPREVVAAAVACRNGVRRAHLVDAATDGAMLIELYTRDGTRGVTMIATDLYEGIRPAAWRDVDGITRLLTHLEEVEGYPLSGWLHEVSQRLRSITVLEREGKVLACACVADLGASQDGARLMELAALVVHPAYRCNGLGDSLLDYVEQDARRAGYGRCLLVQVGRGGYDWFMERGYEPAGLAKTSPLLPRVCANSLPPFAALYSKEFVELDEAADVPAGQRIGF